MTAADLVTPADLARTEERILLAIATATAEILDAIASARRAVLDELSVADGLVPGPTTPPEGPANEGGS